MGLSSYVENLGILIGIVLNFWINLERKDIFTTLYLLDREMQYLCLVRAFIDISDGCAVLCYVYQPRAQEKIGPPPQPDDRSNLCS